jgi:hypothetical protein
VRESPKIFGLQCHVAANANVKNLTNHIKFMSVEVFRGTCQDYYRQALLLPYGVLDCRRPRPIVLILWLLDSMQDASSAFNFATSPRWVRWEFHCLPRFHCAQRLPSGLAGGSSHAGATQSRANICRDRRRTMQIVWRSAIASLRPMPCQS